MTTNPATQPGGGVRSSTPMRVLVTGATGYVGSRLVPLLLERGHTVFAASRKSSGTEDYPWDDQVQTRVFDVEKSDTIAQAVEGIDAVIYLVHSMESEDFARKDRESAERVAAACEAAGVRRVVYLSGLVPSGDLSEHLRSRQEVEQVLLDSGVPTTVLRASMVIGAGSTSFELLRRLSQRVPWVTPVPAWMRSQIQPIAVEDIIAIIASALDGPARNAHYDVGGDEVLTYTQLLAEFAEVDGLRRVRVLVPWLPRWLVGRGCARIADLPKTEVYNLIDSLRHDMLCQETTFRGDLLSHDFKFTTVAEAIRRSLRAGGAPGTSHHGDVQAAAPTDPA